MTDRRGPPLAAVVTPGQRDDSAQFEAALDAVAVRRPSGQVRNDPAGCSPTGATTRIGSGVGCDEGGSGP